MNNLTILFLHRLWPICGGGETVTICNANEMVKRGYNVHVLFFKDSKLNNPLLFIDEHIFMHKIKQVKFNEKSKEFFVDKKEAAYVSKELVTYVNDNNIDIIINQWWPVEFLHGIRTQTNAKIIKCLHMEPDSKKVFDYNWLGNAIISPLLPLYRFVEHQKHMYSCDKYFKYSDLFVFLAPSFLKWYRDRRPSAKIKTDYVFNPLVYKIEGKVDFTIKEKTVLFVGRLNEVQKKITRILKIWRIVEKDPSLNDWKLQIVGDGPYKNMYHTMISRLGLRRVSMEGYQYPLNYYQKASIFVMTSAFEGFPMTLLEAQQNGVVPIGMDTFLSIRDVIINNVNGILVRDNNLENYAESLIYLMKHPQICKKMAIQGYENCLKFDVVKVVDRWETIFNSLIENRV